MLGLRNTPTQGVDLQVCEEQIFIQVEESHNEVGQDPASQ